jgi:arylsulfatase A-like enzyme
MLKEMKPRWNSPANFIGFKARIATVLAFTLLASCGDSAKSGSSYTDPTRPPNIVLIMADDLGYETIGAYGGTSYETPNIDALAASGMRFDAAHANPLCTPSRVKIMTGRYNLRNYTQARTLPPGEKTFAHVLAEAGYKTLVAGKWQLGLEGGQWPDEAGFDEHIAWFISEKGERYWDPHLTTNGIVEDHLGSYGPDLLTDYIGDFMLRNRDQPFLVYYPMLLVHAPFELPPGKSNRQDEPDPRPSMVEYMDHMIGKVVDKVDELGLLEQTLIVVLGDNGSRKDSESYIGDQLIVGGKSLPTDAGTHVPLIASWPGVVPASSVNSNIVDLTAVLPTLAEAAHAEAYLPEAIDGVSILNQLEGKPGNPRDWIYIYYRPKQDDADMRHFEFARDARFKLYTTGDLFDLDQDILEENPIAVGTGDESAEAARVRLAAIIEEIYAGGGLNASSASAAP